jgi:L-lactate permease
MKHFLIAAIFSFLILPINSATVNKITLKNYHESTVKSKFEIIVFVVPISNIFNFHGCSYTITHAIA